MKKIILSIIILLSISTIVQSQVKVNFFLSNPRLQSGNLLVDIKGTVNSGQTWNAGPTCIRFNYYTTNPANAILITPESPVSNANTNLSGNSNYDNITSTSILNGSGGSLNILLLYTRPAFQLTAGEYWLGTVKFAVTDTQACMRMNFAQNSTIFDGSNPLNYGTDWSYNDIDTCLIMPNAIKNITEIIPTEYKLSQNYPNPFNPVTMITFSIPQSSDVKLKVYNILGKQVAELVNEHKSAGTYRVDFDASNLSSGVYFYKLETEKFSDVKRMIFIK